MEEIKILETDTIELEELGKISNEVKEIDFDNVSLALESEEEDGEIQTSDVVLRQKNEQGKEVKYLHYHYHTKVIQMFTKGNRGVNRKKL